MATSSDPFAQIEAELDEMSEIEVLGELNDCGADTITDDSPKEIAKRILRWLKSLLD